MEQSKNSYQEFEKSPLAKSEEKIQQFWQDHQVFKKSLDKEAPQGEFVFYEGPPTANGRPGIHHLESRAFKDAIPRYKTMQGYHVDRRAGWDTHGLPVELEVEKQLGFNGKPDIEKYGIAEFNDKCRESVMKYVDEWQAFTDRIGYWVDHDRAYFTFNPEYMESVWWVFSQAEKNGLLYKDYKVLPWCSRCGTALSSHELAQGYKDVKDLSVTARFELVDEPGVFVLAWTTTPWTLPGNVALAVGEDINYVQVKSDDGQYILAADLVESVFAKADKKYEVVAEFKGLELVGKKYVPLYAYLSDLITGDEKQALADKGYQIYAADFVTTDDGTGVVHTAVMYGQDDFVLGNKIGLPKFHLVDEEGHFIDGTDFLTGRFVKDDQVAIDIIRDLALREDNDKGPILLFDKEKYEHSYPHCWRCKTPLIYYARDSWYIAMSDLRDRLLENNSDINWEPDYIKEGRMGEWLRGIKDWAVSRERYWGTPMPVWESDDGDRIVVDSIKTLKQHLPETTFKFIRHGEGTHNVANVADSGLDSTHNLTDVGVDQVRKAAKSLKNVDMIISSPLLRSRQTAEIIAQELGIDKDQIAVDERVREINFGEFDGKSIDDWFEARQKSGNDYTYTPNDGESFVDVKKRVAEFIDEVAANDRGKNILVVTHGAVLETAKPAANGYNLAQSQEYFHEVMRPEPASVIEVEHYPIPKDESGELNLHRPYVDDVVLYQDGQEYRRTPEVMDVWFDSGSMPWAQEHFPFKTAELTTNNEQPANSLAPSSYPADYISEAIDQTRGWFYVLQAIAAFQGLDQAPYKNVICLGHILDAEGLKMSKSKGNTVNPWEMIARYGADALRFWMYSVNQPGEPKNFDEKTVDEIVKKVFNLLRNSITFYEMFSEAEHAPDPLRSPHVLDQWLLSRYGQLRNEVTGYLDDYKLLEATRSIRDFVGDLSQWYIRRSRDRFKGQDQADLSYALATTRYVFKNTAKLLAPFTPYLGEEVWQALRDSEDVVSVHLSNWPTEISVDQQLLTDMDRVRDLASVGLALRSKAEINARQPLQSFTHEGTELSPGLQQVLADELNVKEIIVSDSESIDTELTPELVNEGQQRELVRAVQSLRKKADLVPSDEITLYVVGADQTQLKTIEGWDDQLQLIAGVTTIEPVDEVKSGKTVEVETGLVTVGIKKI